jgi:hypothetical protein
MTLKSAWLSAVLSLFILTACSKGPHSDLYATVLMRDGTRVSGTVVSSSPTVIQVMSDDQVTHNFPMSLVRSVDYRERRGADSASAFDAVHDEHYHAPESAITTRTFELPAGTQISVRNEETID